VTLLVFGLALHKQRVEGRPRAAVAATPASPVPPAKSETGDEEPKTETTTETV